MSCLGVISDIHGNYYALKAVIDDLHRQNVFQILCLGDIAGYYSMINECIDLILKEKVICLKGNHDSYLLNESSCERSKSVMDCIRYQQTVLNREYLGWLGELKPFQIVNGCVAMHGGLNDFVDEYVDKFDFELAKIKFPHVKIFLSGHTHKQVIQKSDTQIYCNPGSVGQPRDYNNKAAYAIIRDSEVSLHRVSYDIDKTAENMASAGFSEYYFNNLYLGCKIGEYMKS